MRLKKILLPIAFSALLLIFPALNILADGTAIPVIEQQFSSKAYLLMEASTGQVLKEYDAQTPLPIGTLNKIMTVLLVAEAIDAKKLNLDDLVTTSAKANSMKQAVIWLKTGEKMSVKDLLKGVIIGNANDASVALAEAVATTEDDFVKLMNARAKELGMANTVFKNCTGYDVENQGSTAYDVALMTRELLHHQFLYEYMTCWTDNLRNGETSLVNSNVLVKNYNGIIGVKAGFSEAAGNCLSAAATRDGMTYIAVTLGNADKDARFSEAKALMNSGFSGYKLHSPTFSSDVLSPIKVKGGVENEALVRAENLVSLVIPKGTEKDIRTEVSLPETIEAPVAEAQIVGEISFFRGDAFLFKTNLIAIYGIKEMTVGEALCILLKNVFAV
ncbi:MAG: D-alanyl-D-alanine carboxypeptidase family protein, partial [Oscillospiraceae bacterium]